MLNIDLDLLKVLCVLTDQITKQKISSLNGLQSFLSFFHIFLMKWNKAEQLQVQVLDIRKKLFSVEHPETLRSMGNLASTYFKKGI